MVTVLHCDLTNILTVFLTTQINTQAPPPKKASQRLPLDPGLGSQSEVSTIPSAISNYAL